MTVTSASPITGWPYASATVGTTTAAAIATNGTTNRSTDFDVTFWVVNQ